MRFWSTSFFVLMVIFFAGILCVPSIAGSNYYTSYNTASDVNCFSDSACAAIKQITINNVSVAGTAKKVDYIWSTTPCSVGEYSVLCWAPSTGTFTGAFRISNPYDTTLINYVSDLAALPRATMASFGDVAVIQYSSGVYTGGGAFRYYSTCPVSVDSGTLGVAISDGDTGCMYRESAKDYISVTDYGASATVGDNSAAINAALSRGGKIVFPSAVYNVSHETLISKSGTYLSGAGATIRLSNGAYSNLTHSGILSVYDYTNSVPVSNVVIDGITIDGNKTNNDDTVGIYGDGIRSYAASHITVKNVYVHDVPRDGMNFTGYLADGTPSDIKVVNSTSNNNGSTSETAGGEGIFVGIGENVVISGNSLTGNKLRGIDLEVGYPAGSTVTKFSVASNVMKNNAYGGVGIVGATNGDVSGNSVLGGQYGIWVGAAGVYSDVSLVGNSVQNSSVYGIYGLNMYRMSTASNILNQNGYGIYLHGVVYSSFNGDIVTESVHNGIDFTTGSNASLSFYNCGVYYSNTSADATSSNIAGSSVNAKIAGCTAIPGANTKYNLNATGGSIWSVVDNNFSTSASSGNFHDGGVSGLRVHGNWGVATEASGTGSIAVGATSATITHGLDITPTAGNIVVTATSSNAVGNVFVTAVGGTTFQVNATTAPTGTAFTFSWQAKSTN